MPHNMKTAKKSNIPAEDSSAAEGPSRDKGEELEEEVPIQDDSTANEGEDPSAANDNKDSVTDGGETGNDNVAA